MTSVERRMASRAEPARSWFLVGASLALLAAGRSPAEALPEPLPLAWCLERAQATNPDLDVARTAAEAAAARVYPAGALPDPRFSYEASTCRREI